MAPIQSILIAAISHAAPAAAAVYIYWGVALWKGSEVHQKHASKRTCRCGAMMIREGPTYSARALHTVLRSYT